MESFLRASPTIRAALPEDFSDAERERFFDLVVAGGEVGGAVLATNIAEARILVMLIDAGIVCGIAALKRPRSSYRDKTSAKSETNLDAAAFPYELGYVYVLPSHQGKGYSHRLIAAALDHSDGVGVFATVRMDNGRMRATFEKAGFVAAGKTYPGRHQQAIGTLLRAAA
ncbi:GNAT family N-acetyltransferase [Sphingomonas glacialis]|uniref:GNAT family N-acetyltransferase n=1 Tax=Sphingomonas glacialis TaxID=658225 RepID=A0A502G4A8_9SPHN|nr:GNAT family N-acetyltransferase [Sphingomonas glacialis]TPG56584.1 GNAT family N-acetyltransferase [Sphingomonas glacialis]